jgi:hypothetical protein
MTCGWQSGTVAGQASFSAILKSEWGKESAILQASFHTPAPGLEQFVRFYVQRKVRIRDAPVVHPVPARATPMSCLNSVTQPMSSSLDTWHRRNPPGLLSWVHRPIAG